MSILFGIFAIGGIIIAIIGQTGDYHSWWFGIGFYGWKENENSLKKEGDNHLGKKV